MKSNWNSDDSFPLAEGGWCAWRPPFGRRRTGELEVNKITRRWHPLDPLLISYPGVKRQLPPICFPEFASGLQKRATFQYNVLLMLIAGMFIGFASIGVFTKNYFFLRIAIALLLILGFVLLQQFLIFKKIGRLQNFSRLVAWCYLQPRVAILFVGISMLLLGALQFYLQWKVGDIFSLAEKFGLVFDKARIQPWRYITGPFFHSGFIHYISNYSLLIVTSGLALGLGRCAALCLIFLVGAIVPGYFLSFLPYSIRQDAFFGLSGGIFSLLGWVIGITFRRKFLFPVGIWKLLAYFAVMSVIVPTLLDPRVNWFIHSLGLVFGLVAGLFEIGFKKDIGNC